MKIDIIGFADQILEEYNIVRTNPKFFAFKINTFKEKIEKDLTRENENVYFFKNSSGTKIVLRNATAICDSVAAILDSMTPIHPLIRNELLVATARKGLDTIKQSVQEREEQLRSIYSSFSSDINKVYGSIFGFGDYDPSLIVTLQLIDSKDDSYSRKCILNSKFNYCGINVVESEKLRVLSVSHFID